MFTATPAATREVQRLLEQEGYDPEKVFVRLYVSAG